MHHPHTTVQISISILLLTINKGIHAYFAIFTDRTYIVPTIPIMLAIWSRASVVVGGDAIICLLMSDYILLGILRILHSGSEKKRLLINHLCNSKIRYTWD